MQDGGKEKTLCVYFLHVYPEAEDLGSSHESLLAMAPNHWGWQRGREFTHVKEDQVPAHVGGSAVF